MAKQIDLDRWNRRGNSSERGLGAEHRKLREELIPDALGEICPLGTSPDCMGIMDDPSFMELDHSEARALNHGSVGDRIVCAPCNHSEGAKLGNALRREARREFTQARIDERDQQAANHGPLPLLDAIVDEYLPPLMITADQASMQGETAWDQRRKRRRWREDPNAWAADHGIELYSKQREINTAVATHPRVAIRSCHSSGKSYDMAVLTAWWLDVHEQGEARVVTTAPTGDQVRGILWVEINGLWERLELPGRKNQSEIWFGSYQAAVGRKSSDYNPAAFSGWHAKKLLVIVDEADGVSLALWSAIDTLVTNAGAKVVGIGNPDDPTSEFRKRQNDQPYGGTYHTIRIAAWDTPNFTDEPVSDAIENALLSPAWVAEMRKKWGARTDDEIPDHPFWQSKVEAEYPDESSNTVIRLTDLLRARRFERDGALAKTDDRHAVSAGVDVAGSDNGDESVIRGRRGLRLLDQFTIQTADPEELEDWMIDYLDVLGAGHVAIDADGIGFGFAGAIRRRRGKKISVAAIRSGASANDPKAYVNRRAEMWWNLRDMLSKTGDEQLDFTLIDDGTAAQLLMPRYSTDKKGKIQVEAKVDLRKRLGRSPDNADAIVYIFAKDVASGTMKVTRGRRHLAGRTA